MKQKIIKIALSFAIMVTCFYTSTSSQKVKAEEKIKIACIGDSLTDGYLSTQGNKSATAYPAQLQEMLGDDFEVGNFGKTSYTLMKGTDRSYWDSTEYINSKSFNPDYVIIMLGTNDCKEMYWDAEQYKKDAKALYDEYANLATKPKIIFALSPCVYGNDVLITTQRVNILHEVQVDLVAEMNWDHIDMYAQTIDKQYLYHNDGIHFSDNGYHYIAQCMYQKLTNGAMDLEVDRSVLFQALTQYQKMYANSLNYTTETYNVFYEAYKEASQVKRDMSANQARIDDVVSKLLASAEQLESIEWEALSSNLINENANSDVKVIEYTSQCVLGGNPNEDGEASNLLDFDATTYWHTDWSNVIGMPQSVTFDLGDFYELSDVTLLPRQGAAVQGNGDPIEIKLYGGHDEEQLAYLGSYAYALNGNILANRNNFVRVYLSQKPSIRYLKYEVVSAGGSDGNRYTNAAEIRFYGTKDTTPPEMMDDVQCKNTSTSLEVTWSASPSEDVEKYIIMNANTQEIYGETTQLSYMMEDLTPNTKYEILVKAVDYAGNESTNTQAFHIYTLPLIVSGLKAEDTNYKTITLTWDAQPGEVSYDIFVMGDYQGYEYITTVSENTYQYTNAMTGKEYYLDVIAKNPMYYGVDYTSTRMTTTLKGNVTLKMEQVSTAKFKLSWNKINGATRYIVYRKRNDDKMKKVLTLNGSTLAYTTAELPNGDYEFIVKAGRYDSSDRVMTNASNKVRGSVEKVKPTITVTAGSKSALVSWKKMEGVTHYQVYRATSSGGKYTKLATTKELRYTAKSLTKGKKYYFKVRGYKAYKSGTQLKYNVYTPYSSAKAVIAN